MSKTLNFFNYAGKIFLLMSIILGGFMVLAYEPALAGG